MEQGKKPKQAKLYDDEFNPHRAFKSFWRIPRQVMALEDISLGAKVLYGVLATNAGSFGTSYTLKETLQAQMGNPSLKSMYNWQRELIKKGLLRVRQKGRGLPNNYYFLRSYILGNAEEFEFEEGERCVYRGPQVSSPIILTVEIAKQFYAEDVIAWYDRKINGIDAAFPKPCWQYNRKQFKEYRNEWEAKVIAYFETA